MPNSASVNPDRAIIAARTASNRAPITVFEVVAMVPRGSDSFVMYSGIRMSESLASSESMFSVTPMRRARRSRTTRMIGSSSLVPPPLVTMTTASPACTAPRPP